jgi:hypothetical protein
MHSTPVKDVLNVVLLAEATKNRKAFFAESNAYLNLMHT